MKARGRRGRVWDMDLRETILYRLARASRILRRVLSRDQDRYGLSNGGDLVLIEIARRGGARPKEIRDELGMGASSVSSILRQTGMAYCTRRPDPSDGRTFLAEASDLGHLCAALMAEAWRYHDRRVSAALTPAERVELLRLVRKVEAVLEEMAREAPLTG